MLDTFRFEQGTPEDVPKKSSLSNTLIKKLLKKLILKLTVFEKEGTLLLPEIRVSVATTLSCRLKVATSGALCGPD